MPNTRTVADCIELGRAAENRISGILSARVSVSDRNDVAAVRERGAPLMIRWLKHLLLCERHEKFMCSVCAALKMLDEVDEVGRIREEERRRGRD